MTNSSITIKTPEELQLMREAGAILASVINEVKCSLKSGMTTLEADQKAEELIKKHKVIPAFKGYRGFPGCVCFSAFSLYQPYSLNDRSSSPKQYSVVVPARQAYSHSASVGNR